MTICTYVEWIDRTYIFLKKYKEKVATYPRVYTVSERGRLLSMETWIFIDLMERTFFFHWSIFDPAKTSSKPWNKSIQSISAAGTSDLKKFWQFQNFNAYVIKCTFFSLNDDQILFSDIPLEFRDCLLNALCIFSRSIYKNTVSLHRKNWSNYYSSQSELRKWNNLALINCIWWIYNWHVCSRLK